MALAENSGNNEDFAYSDCESENKPYKAKYQKHKSRSQGRLVHQITVETCTADSDDDNTLRPTDLQIS